MRSVLINIRATTEIYPYRHTLSLHDSLPNSLRPLGVEVADLVAALANVPGLGDELHLADDRVLVNEVEERGEAVDLVELAGQGRRQVEAEPVDVHLGHPVAQRVHDQLQRVGVSHVEAVTGAGGVVVEGRSEEHTSELQ